MTTASAIPYRVPPFAAAHSFDTPHSAAGAARRHGARARAFAICHLAGASTLCPSRLRWSRAHSRHLSNRSSAGGFHAAHL